jgi:hypothetical protein
LHGNPPELPTLSPPVSMLFTLVTAICNSPSAGRIENPMLRSAFTGLFGLVDIVSEHPRFVGNDAFTVASNRTRRLFPCGVIVRFVSAG